LADLEPTKHDTDTGGTVYEVGALPGKPGTAPQFIEDPTAPDRAENKKSVHRFYHFNFYLRFFSRYADTFNMKEKQNMPAIESSTSTHWQTKQ
jgi:hypothetical protein